MLVPDESHPTHNEHPSRPAEPLVPILRVEEGLADRTALATWHEALSDALASDVQHDLLGLWLFPASGGPVLLGPEALAQDKLAVPLPSPQLQPHQLATLERVIREAGYKSVISLPVRFGRRDVGLMLVADLRPDRYGESEMLTLRLVAQRLGSPLGRLARQWPTASGEPVPQVERIAALLEAVAGINGSAATPQRFLAALSPTLDQLLPHDHLELLLGDPSGSRFYRLGEHAGGPLWADPSLIIEKQYLDIVALFGHHDRLILSDAWRESRWPRGYFTVADPAGVEPRAIVGARLHGAKGQSAYLLAASVGAGLYGEDDATLLGRLAALIAPRVALMIASAGQNEVRPSIRIESDHMIASAATLLATCSNLGEVTSRIRDLAAKALPFDEMRYAIRLSEGDRVVLVEPGERRALPDLPLIPVAGTALDQVLAGELSSSFSVVDGEARLLVPLRVGGRLHGALMLTARQPALLREAHLPVAQQLADIVAPHLELLRRAALLPPPYLPGWKRTQRN
jgi:GAF domain-containing protein